MAVLLPGFRQNIKQPNQKSIKSANQLFIPNVETGLWNTIFTETIE